MAIGQPVEVGGPTGYSYRGVIVRAGRDEVLEMAAGARFSGWVGPDENGHVVLVPSGDHLLVAAGGRDPEAFGADLASLGPVLVVEVVRDRLLSLVLLAAAGAEPLRYLSDPSVLDADDMDEPRGAHHAPALARAFGASRGNALKDVLAESLDSEHYIESERLGRVLDLLGLPGWLITAWSLPRRAYGGPDPRSLTRLRAGRAGPTGWPLGWPAERARRVRQWARKEPDGPRPDGLGGGPSLDELW